MIRLEHLQSLDAVARLGTIAAAANALNLTPSAVSQQLSRLARDVGTPLHVPQGRGVRLTAAGQFLAQAADRILAEVADAETRLRSLDDSIQGPLRLGSIPSGVHSFVTDAIDAISTTYPDVDMSLIETEPECALPMLFDDSIDVAVVESWENMPLPRPSGTLWRLLQDDTASLVLPADLIPDDEPFDIAAVRDCEWVGWTLESRAHAWMVQALRERQIEPVVKHCVTGYATQFALVARLRAAALVPTMALAALPETLRAEVRIEPLSPSLCRRLFAVTRRAVPRPAVDAFIEALVTAADAGSAQAQNIIGGSNNPDCSL